MERSGSEPAHDWSAAGLEGFFDPEPTEPGGVEPEHRPGRVGMLGRVLVLSAAAGVLLATVFGLIIWFTASHAPTTGAARQVKAYLSELRDGRYAEAYERLCDGDQSVQAFVERQQGLAAGGRAVASFQIHPGFTGDSSTFGSAGGVVTYADGSTATLRFDLQTFDLGGGIPVTQCLLPS